MVRKYIMYYSIEQCPSISSRNIAPQAIFCKPAAGVFCHAFLSPPQTICVLSHKHFYFITLPYRPDVLRTINRDLGPFSDLYFLKSSSQNPKNFPGASPLDPANALHVASRRACGAGGIAQIYVTQILSRPFQNPRISVLYQEI